MRVVRLPIAALLFVLASMMTVPGAAGQDAAAAVLVAEDAASDVALVDSAVPASMPSGAWDSLDLRSLSVTETVSTIHVLLAVGAVGTTQESFTSLIQYEVLLRHADTHYKLFINPFGNGAYGTLARIPDGQDLDRSFGEDHLQVQVAVDAGAATFDAAIPREALLDSEGNPPTKGRSLDSFQAEAGLLNDARANGQPLPAFEDLMPDAGVAQAAYEVVHGLQQVGDLRLSSELPLRTSNGEASTFVYTVVAENLAEDDIVAEFVTVGVPPGWDVRTPGLVRLDGESEVDVPIVVRTAFSHDHGSVAAFTLELVGQDSAGSIGRIQLGLRYPLIAQPAGHHDTVYLHSRDHTSNALDTAIGVANTALGGTNFNLEAYFNTALPEDDPNDQGIAVPGSLCESLRVLQDNDTVGSTYCWSLPLSPALEMGLDFDLERTGTYQIPFHALVPQPGARAAGRIVHYAPGEEDPMFGFFFSEGTTVATLLPSDRADLGLDQRLTFEGVIQPEEDGDYLEHAVGASLWLELELRTNRPENFYLGPRTPPELVAGGMMQLPLLEYEDPVQDFQVSDALALDVAGSAQRLANPGETAVYNVTVRNGGDETQQVRPALIGSNLDWATLVSPPTLSLSPGEEARMQVIVRVPADAQDGDRSDLVVEVASTSDVAQRGLLRLVTTADTDQDHRDESAALSGLPAAKSPSVPGLSLLAVLGFAWLRRR